LEAMPRNGLLILLLALACTPAAAPKLPDTPPSISGRITNVARAGEKIGSIRVEAQPADSAGSDKAVAKIGQGTTVVGVGGAPTDFNELKVGQWVRVWFSGPVAQSYPVQATASAVAIDSLAK
jgi:hypothetical protein